MLSVWRCKFESVEKCESGWSKVQYVCDTVMLTLKDQVCYYSITNALASSLGSRVAPELDRLSTLPLQVWLTGLEQDGPPTLHSVPATLQSEIEYGPASPP